MKSTFIVFCATCTGLLALFASSDSLRITPLAVEKGVAFGEIKAFWVGMRDRAKASLVDVDFLGYNSSAAAEVPMSVKGTQSVKVYQAAWHCGSSRNATFDLAC